MVASASCRLPGTAWDFLKNIFNLLGICTYAKGEGVW